MTEFCQVQYSLYVEVLRFRILAALLHGTTAAGVSPTAAWYTEWNCGTFAEGAIFGWAAITLDIGPHSSLLLVQALDSMR